MNQREFYKMTGISALMITIPIIVLSYFFVFETLNSRKQAETEKNIVIIKTAGMSIEHAIDENFEDMSSMSLAPVFMQLDGKQIDKILDTYHYGSYRHYFVLDTKGRLIACSSSHQLKKLTDSEDRAFKQALQGNKAISDQHYDPTTGKFVFTLFYPILNSSKKVIGVIGSDIPITLFRDYLAPIKIGKSGSLGLIDSKGFYIYSGSVDNSKKLVPALCYNDGIGQDLNITERPSLRTGKTTVYTKVKLKKSGWYIVGFQPLEELNSPGKLMAARNSVVFALLFIIIVILWRYKVLMNNRNLIIQRQHTEKLALIGELAAGMAHEIRNPLTTIKGFSTLLQKKDKYKEDKEYLELLIQSVDHIEGIVRETLLLAKPQKMTIKDIELGHLLKQVYHFMKNETLLREVGFELKTEDMPINISGDELHLKQVFVNILKNAIEATDQGGSVTLRLKRAKNEALIEIRDTGTGITPETLQKLGTPFFTTKLDGTGLGLSVSQRMIEEHGGKMEIDSKVGKGTTVKIYLPLKS